MTATQLRAGWLARLGEHHLLIAAGALLLLCRLIAAAVLPVYDDAFITLRYACNLAAGDGFVYQPGEWVLGTTAPGYGLVAALLCLARLPLPESVVALGIAADLATYALTLALLPPATRLTAGLTFAALFALSPIAGRIAAGGMEMNLFVAVSLAAVWLLCRGRAAAALGLAGLAYLLRPEAVILVAILAAAAWLRGERRPALRGTLIAVSLVGLALLLIWLRYGQPLPQSVVAKSQLARPGLPLVLRQLLAPDPLVGLMLPLALAGALRYARHELSVALIAAWLTLYVGLYAAARPSIWSWYVAPIVCCVLALAALGVAAAAGRWPRLAALLAAWPARAALLLVPLLAWGVVLARGDADAVERRVYAPIARWCREEVRPGASILAYDIGAVGFYCDARIYDLAGLVWPPALRSASSAALVRDYRPDYLLLNASREGLALVAEPDLARTYQPAARFSRAGATELRPDPASLPEGWVQDYILYRRVVEP